jgi:hypothetical protein
VKRLIQSLFFAATIFATQQSLQAQTAPAVAWDKTFGGSSEDKLLDFTQTSDGGYIIGGLSQSGISGDKTQATRGGTDYWIVKTDAAGNKIWDKTFGGIYFDGIGGIAETFDGGYILAGDSFSPISGDKTQASRGGTDFWVIKIDALGNKAWDKTFGGSNTEEVCAIKRTLDGGYIFGGTSYSPNSGDKTQVSRGGTDFWVVKIDANGNKVWDKTFGGSLDDEMFALNTTADGGYILGGRSSSWISLDKTQPNNGPAPTYDFWFVKIDGLGNKLWDKTFGGNNNDWINAIQQTADGGYILGGTSASRLSADKTEDSKGLLDYWIIKTDATGNKVWDKVIGGISNDVLTDLQIMPDGSYAIGGSSQSSISGDKTQNNMGNQADRDYWVVRLDVSGNKIWDKTIGSGADEACTVMARTTNGDLVVGGWSLAGISGDKTQVSRGNEDCWLVKLNPTCADLTASLAAPCSSGGTTVNLNVTGIQAVITGTPSWTFTYTVNSITQTATGTTNTFTLATNAAPGAVYSLVSIASGTCTNPLTNTLTVQTVPATPTVTPGNNCGMGMVTLSASGAPTGGNYIWYSAATGGTVLQSNATGTFTTPSLSTTTTYFVSATNSSGCEGPRTPITATITNLTANAGTNETICFNAAPVQLTGFSPAGGTWSGSGVSATGLFTPTSSLVGNQTLTYTVTQNGCSATSTKQVTVPAAIAQPVISLIAPDTLISSVTGSSYVWKHNNATLPNTTRKLKATASGTYAVQVKDASNCSSTFSPDYSFVISGTKEDLAAGMQLYPNPTSGIINLVLADQQAAQVTVLNALGQEVLIKTVGTSDSKAVHPLDLGGLPKGIYMVQVWTDKQIMVQKVVVE